MGRYSHFKIVDENVTHTITEKDNIEDYIQVYNKKKNIIIPKYLYHWRKRS